jgi:hypothetical protein|tara:strand:+ start:1385 stop:1915 length:531 start_codon:yes stop_codon:yes gene_type:complete
MNYIKIIPTILLVIVVLFASNQSFNINQLQYQSHEQDVLIDSLKRKIDTLMLESQIWDYNFSPSNTHLLSAIMFVESSNNDSAYHKGEDAVGCLQIRKCMVDDVNRILTINNSYQRFTYEDRWSRHMSVQMFDIYRKHYNLTTSEEVARCWNGGPRGMQKELTAGYWEKVNDMLDI